MDGKDRWVSLKAAVENERSQLDAMIAAWLQTREVTGRRIFCGAGCSRCCTLFVQATLAEALIVAEGLDAAQFTRLEEYVLRQRQCFVGEHDFLTILRKQRSTLGPCPFVDPGGCCSIYDLRPLACRALLSTKPAEWCSVDFSTLDPLEKRLYLESLERETVAYPVHYVASTQNEAQSAEERLTLLMEEKLGTAISGNLPLLVYLATTMNLVGQIKAEDTNWQTRLQTTEFFHPLLLRMPAVNPVESVEEE